MSTKELVKSAKIGKDDLVLDLACGTGVVAKELSQIILRQDRIIGIDFARTPLEIAKSENMSCNFVEMDAEHIGLRAKFDAVLCQYALMFFPEPERVLLSLSGLLKPGGRLAVAVHGTAEGVPYFSTIMDPVLMRMPDIRPAGAPNVHRFGTIGELERIISSSGFSEITVKKFVFQYKAGTFAEYWSDYMSGTAHSIRSKIESRDPQVVEDIRSEAEERSKKYTSNGRIVFPWDVLVATAVKK